MDLLKFMMEIGIYYHFHCYVISVKWGNTDTISYSFAKMKVDSYDFLPLEKVTTSIML